jgi:protein-ribulosamine 3-kinase
MLLAESKALEYLKSFAGIFVPTPKRLATYNGSATLILNWIEKGPASKHTFRELAETLVALHKFTADNFGFEYDNFIGTLPQRNDFTANWSGFYYNFRINPQLKLAIDSGLIPKAYMVKTEKMFQHLNIECLELKPSLLHGDLWGGNWMIDQSGRPVLIDPAIYFGHREMDIAMMQLFGGFPDAVFDIYNEIFPLEHDWKIRLKFYQLYYVLVHVNLFGSSYSNHAMSIINSYQ